MNGRLRVQGAVFGAILSLAVVSGRAADWHVAPGGSDVTGNGSEGNPFATIIHAIGQAATNDIVNASTGVFAIASAIVVDKPLTIRGAQAGNSARSDETSPRNPEDAGAESILDAAANATVVFDIQSDNVVVDGFSITGSAYLTAVRTDGVTSRADVAVANNFVWRDADAASTYAIDMNNVTNAVVQGNSVRNFRGDSTLGAITLRYSHAGRVYGNEVTSTRSGDSQTGVSVTRDSSDTVIERNWIHEGVGKSGIFVPNSGGDAHATGGVTIRNNRIDTFWQAAISLRRPNVVVEGNVITGGIEQNAMRAAIWVRESVCTNIVIRYNTVYDTQLGGSSGNAPVVLNNFVVDQADSLVTVNNNWYNNVHGGSSSVGAESLVGFTVELADLTYPAVPDARNNWWGHSEGPSTSIQYPETAGYYTDAGDPFYTTVSNGFGAAAGRTHDTGNFTFGPWALFQGLRTNVTTMGGTFAIPADRLYDGNFASHAHANFRDIGSYGYADGTAGWHPDYEEGATPYTSPVGSFAPNGYGLYDMAGNMYSWCWDWFDADYYSYSPVGNPRGPASGDDGMRTARGGAYDSDAIWLRNSDRGYLTPGYDAYNGMGFRTVYAPTGDPETVLTNMAYVPFGSFAMGDTFNEGQQYDGGGVDIELPVHTNTLSAFYMDQYHVTLGLWNDVRNWATNNGYAIPARSGKEADHPVHSVTWYDAVKWCNARSEMEGLTPSYYTSTEKTTNHIYRSGNVDVENDWVLWDAGYRLPTEAEYEKAARGGVYGWRFPWGDAGRYTRHSATLPGLSAESALMIQSPAARVTHAAVRAVPSATEFMLDPAVVVTGGLPTVTIEFKDTEIPAGETASNMRLTRWNPVDEAWELVVGSSVDVQNKLVSGTVGGFSVFGAMALDSDGDGIPDWWEVEYFGGATNAVASSDFDEDETSNLQEYIAGTNPTNGQSRFEIAGIGSDVSGVKVWFESVDERWYSVDFKDDLIDTGAEWTLLTNDVLGGGSVVEIQDATVGVTQRFYRIRVRR